jgi:hypothetical protein
VQTHPAGAVSGISFERLLLKEFVMSDKNSHGINLANRKVHDAKAESGKVMALIKILVLAASLTLALGYLTDRSRGQDVDDQGDTQREQGFTGREF